MADALFASSGVTDAREARLASGGLLAVQGPSALDVRTGVLAGPGSTTLVTGTAATGPMTVQIAPHVVVGSRGVANGPYLGPVLEAATTVQIAAAPASGSRIDVVYAKQQDNTSGIPSPDVSAGPLYGVLAGTAASSPTKPALTAVVGAEELATVQVSAGATSTNGANVVITNTARQTAARGALILCRNRAERDALTGYPTLRAYQLDTKTEYFHDGTAWRFVRRDGSDGPYVAYRTSAAITGWPGGQVFGGAPVVDANTDTAMFTTTAGSDTATGNRVTVQEAGRYEVALALGVEYSPAGTNYYANMAPVFGGTAVGGKAAYWNGRAVGGGSAPNSQWQDFSWNQQLWLPAGTDVRIATAANPQPGQSVRYSIIELERIG